MPWKVKVYVPIEADKDEIYTSPAEALDVAENLEAMQPENVYQVVSCDDKGKEI